MTIILETATEKDVEAITTIRNEAAKHLTSLYGKGHWSYQSSEKGVLNSMHGNTKLLVAKSKGIVMGTLRQAEKRPWAIDAGYFTNVPKPLYLVDMVVRYDAQRKGIGKSMLEEVRPLVNAWPGQAIRLDAYNNAAGAGDFYRSCGFTEKGRIIYRNVPLIYFELLLQ